MRQDTREPWVAGQLAATLLAVDPAGLGGIHLRARAGPVRDAFLAGLPTVLTPWHRITPGIDDAQLLGGVDVGASLAAGRRIETAGVLDRAGVVILSMAERCPPDLSARLGQALDRGAGPMVLLDEGAEPDEAAPEGLCDRLAFHLDLEQVRAADMADVALGEDEIDRARLRLPDIAVPDAAVRELTGAAIQLGILGLRAVLLAVAAARAHAALCQRDAVAAEDLQIAAALVYAPRATHLPPEHEEASDESPDPADTEPTENAADEKPMDAPPPEVVLDAVRALLPPGVLESRASRAARRAAGTGQGARAKGTQKGRPLPSRPGRRHGGTRIDLVATLRAAVPWQALRRQEAPDRTGVIVRASDIHLRRFERRTERLVIFCVDASGSAALARMAEAKGAVELMLADAYARRDRVALIAFRGDSADLLLPPTRSLVQAKRRLAALPGGGATPLAAGLDAARAVADRARRAGQAPALALLTDGRANVALSGAQDRAAAMDDARAAAQRIRALGLDGAVIDTGARPRPELAELAAAMGLPCLALPRADAHRLKSGLDAALGT